MKLRYLIATGATAIGVLLLPALVWAHAVVYPRVSTPGAYERYVVRVPNEKDVATTRVELRFAGGLRVISFAEVPGWKLETAVDSAGAIVGATWTGTLLPKRFIELPFIAVNPKDTARITWPVFQTYADGERVDWTGPEGSKAPASFTLLAAAGALEAPTPAGSAGWVAWSALVIALVSLGLAIRQPVAK